MNRKRIRSGKRQQHAILLCGGCLAAQPSAEVLEQANDDIQVGKLPSWPWDAPENGKTLARAPLAKVPIKSVEAAFPDLNCDRVPGGHWRNLRLQLEVLVGLEFGQGSPLAAKGWGRVLAQLNQAYSLSSWLHPLAGDAWMHGLQVSPMMKDMKIAVACPLGVAAVLALSLVARLAEAHEHFTIGTIREGIDVLAGSFRLAAQAFQASLQRALQGPRLVIPVLAATRWPILDILAQAEGTVLKPIHNMYAVLMGGDPGGHKDCAKELGPAWVRLGEFARNFSQKPLVEDVANVAVASLQDSDNV